MQQSELKIILSQITSENVVFHLHNRQELSLKKSSCQIKDGICRSESCFIPCSEILYITSPWANSKTKRKQFDLETREQLWEELKQCEHRALFSGRVITKKDLENTSLVTIEHIIPLSCGGTNDLDNLTLEFVDINSKRGCLLPSQYKKKLSKAERKRYNHDIALLWGNRAISKDKYLNLIK